MKHLVKKYVKAIKFDEEVNDIINNAPIHENEIENISENNAEGYITFAFTENNEMIQNFKYVNKGKTYLIPEPDPIIIYFDTARHYHMQIFEKRSNLFNKSIKNKGKLYVVHGDFYWYFSMVSNYVIFLFLSMEAFINKSIPNDIEYKNEKNKLFNKQQIQRHIDFLEKIKCVLPKETKMNFAQEYSHKYGLIIKLKSFRDEIVHTKSYEGISSPNYYEQLYVTSLDFDFDKTLDAVKDFINYYQPNLIEECLCGKES